MQNQVETAQNSSNKGHLSRTIRKGLSLGELAQRIQHIEETKRDFIVPVDALSANTISKPGSDQNQVSIGFKNGEDHQFSLNNWSGSQVSQFTEIPSRYFQKLSSENPKLLAENINHGLTQIKKDEETKSRLVRTVDGHVRGFLSHRYRTLDSHDLLSAVLPTLVDHEFQVVSCELTEKRLYLKAATPRIQGEVKTGDIVSYGIMLSTSDVGAGMLKVEPFYLALWCLNGAVTTGEFKKMHIGRANAEREVREIMSDDTKKLNDSAFFATVKDYMLNTMRPEIFKAEIEKMRDAAGKPINNMDLKTVVEVTMKTVGITGEKVRDTVLESLVQGAEFRGLNAWGLSNAFTAAAKSQSFDYDTATDLERIGGEIINLNDAQWKRISEVSH